MIASREQILQELGKVIAFMRKRNDGQANERIMLLWMAYDFARREMPKDYQGEYKENL